MFLVSCFAFVYICTPNYRVPLMDTACERFLATVADAVAGEIGTKQTRATNIR